MSEGIIIRFQHKSGKIQGDDGKTYDFNQKAITGGDLETATPGRRVRFEPEGDRARNVVLLSEVVALPKPEPVPAPTPAPVPRSAPVPTPAPRPVAGKTAPSGSYRFLNPYNFVRTLEVRNPKSAPLLGRCAPPPHDRFVGLTGRITCRLTATTPLFISDSEGIDEEPVRGKIHRSYRFFRDPEGNVAIPGTSLRGAVRSTFEATTNSCFAHFADKKRLSYHLLPELALRLIPARVCNVNNRWELELLPGTTPVTPNQRPSGPQYAAWVHVYDPLQRSKTVVQAPTTPYAKRKKLSLAGYQHGEPCQAIVELIRHPRRNFEFWNVVHLAHVGQPMPNPTGNQRLVSGRLCITNQNIENKHDERLFFSTQQHQPIVLSDDARKKYEELIADYQERHGSEKDKRQRPEGREPALSRFILERTGRNEAKLRDGDLVYAMLEGGARGTYTVKFIVPVSVPRVGFKRRIGELLHPEGMTKCSQYDKLCPACRTFGWVWGDDDPKQNRPDLDKATAYASRLRFSHAALTHDAGVFDATLAILSAPKPTTYRFYLRSRDGRPPQDGLSDQQVDYDNDSQILRGRKVYRHHGSKLNRQEYESVAGPNEESDQNRTVHGVQQAGSVFEFTVDFENLALEELGALLWSLRLEGWNHRIGYAKPLGFGSAQIEILEVALLDAEARYASFISEKSGWSNRSSDWQVWVDVFQDAMAARYGTPFERLDNIRDLRSLLSAAPSHPVHYPRPTRHPQAEGKQYEWFVGNKRGGQDPGPRLALRLAEDDREGFPLIDKYGDRSG